MQGGCITKRCITKQKLLLTLIMLSYKKHYRIVHNQFCMLLQLGRSIVHGHVQDCIIMTKFLIPMLAIGAVMAPWAAGAQTATDSFEVRININEDCQITSTETLDFGSTGVLTQDVDKTATLAVACTNTTPFDIGLNEGLGSGADTTTRLMTGAGDPISYRLFRDNAYTINWGNAPTVDTAGGTGTGLSQQFIVYGRVPAQATPTPGAYTDTVTVTVTF